MKGQGFTVLYRRNRAQPKNVVRHRHVVEDVTVIEVQPAARKLYALPLVAHVDAVDDATVGLPVRQLIVVGRFVIAGKNRHITRSDAEHGAEFGGRGETLCHDSECDVGCSAGAQKAFQVRGCSAGRGLGRHIRPACTPLQRCLLHVHAFERAHSRAHSLNRLIQPGVVNAACPQPPPAARTRMNGRMRGRPACARREFDRIEPSTATWPI